MRHSEALIVIIDGQGGGVGRALTEAVKKTYPGAHVRAVGTNALPVKTP